MDNKIVKERMYKITSQFEELCENIKNPLILNNDCWLLICDLLTCHDILNLSKVSQSYKNLVQYLVLPSKLTKWEISFSYDIIGLDDFKFIIDSIYTTVRELRILFLPERHFELLSSYQFPNVTEIRITLSRPMDEADISTLSYVFPNLQEFSPHGICSSKAIELFSNVEHLTLTCCRNLTKSDLGRILLTLNLKSLKLDIFKKVSPLSREEFLKFSKIEVLTLNRIELGLISGVNLSDVHNPIIFRDLKVLIITGKLIESTEVDKLFENIQFIVCRNVSSIEIANVSDDFLSTYFNTEKYDFLNRVSVLKFINTTILNNVIGMPSKYKDLRELYFFYCHAAINLDILTIISNSQKLDVISFEECDIPHIVIGKAFIRDQLGIRRNELVLNWCSKEKNPDVHCYNEYRNLIKLTNVSHISSNFDSMTIQFK
ncbi:uncharacterized protein LOC126763963 [Bactrocera neohumeralis]|uniref:uncharacterized protein LOC126763963 n=1 Tax=Bactrocera neohumeralis TaxID=98809 RepID=UPI002166498F|nr:uncharacterized protein LOC126763963 [Bactrocera neohumeralis]